MKTYLGDGVYVEITDGQVVLTTENGIEIENVIYLDAEIWTVLKNFVTKREDQLL